MRHTDKIKELRAEVNRLQDLAAHIDDPAAAQAMREVVYLRQDDLFALQREQLLVALAMGKDESSRESWLKRFRELEAARAAELEGRE